MAGESGDVFTASTMRESRTLIRTPCLLDMINSSVGRMVVMLV